jgi:hypothetical protein
VLFVLYEKLTYLIYSAAGRQPCSNNLIFELFFTIPILYMTKIWTKKCIQINKMLKQFQKVMLPYCLLPVFPIFRSYFPTQCCLFSFRKIPRFTTGNIKLGTESGYHMFADTAYYQYTNRLEVCKSIFVKLIIKFSLRC